MTIIMKAERKQQAVDKAYDQLTGVSKLSAHDYTVMLRIFMNLYESAYLDCLEELTEKRSRELEAVR